MYENNMKVLALNTVVMWSYLIETNRLVHRKVDTFGLQWDEVVYSVGVVGDSRK